MATFRQTFETFYFPTSFGPYNVESRDYGFREVVTDGQGRFVAECGRKKVESAKDVVLAHERKVWFMIDRAFVADEQNMF